MRNARVVLHPTDLSRASRAAFARAVEWARARRATLLVLHAIAPVENVGDGYLSPEVRRELETAGRARAAREMGALVRAARRAGVRVQSKVVAGAPHDAILRAARARRPEVIVMGTHGRTGLGRLLLGSVATRVTAAARRPVLTVRGR